MKIFPNEAKKIKIKFICDVCEEEVLIEQIEIPEICEINENTICPVCSKEFQVKIKRTSEKSWIEIENIDFDDITVEII